AHVIVEPANPCLDRELGYVLAMLLGADQKIGSIGVEPRHGVAGVAPYPEAAIRALQFDDMADRAVERLRRRRARIGMPKPRHLLDIKQRQCPARRLLEAAIGVAVERPQ